MPTQRETSRGIRFAADHGLTALYTDHAKLVDRNETLQAANDAQFNTIQAYQRGEGIKNAQVGDLINRLTTAALSIRTLQADVATANKDAAGLRASNARTVADLGTERAAHQRTKDCTSAMIRDLTARLSQAYDTGARMCRYSTSSRYEMTMDAYVVTVSPQRVQWQMPFRDVKEGDDTELRMRAEEIAKHVFNDVADQVFAELKRLRGDRKPPLGNKPYGAYGTTLVRDRAHLRDLQRADWDAGRPYKTFDLS